jgi:hypothetical protein
VWWIPFSLSPAGEKPSLSTSLPPEDETPKSFTPITFFAQQKTRTQKTYTEKYKLIHWTKVVKRWEEIENPYKKEIQDWFYDQRKELLSNLFKEKEVNDLEMLILDPTFWKDQEELLKNISTRYFISTMEFVGEDLLDLFKDLGVLETGISFDIYNTSALTKINNRVNKGNMGKITATIRDKIRNSITTGIEQGLTETQIADLIRDSYRSAGSRAATIARTELGGVITDSRVEGIQVVGFKRHSWLSAKDQEVRVSPYNHLIDGETVNIGDNFSNGLRWPNDENGEAGNVINCRCLTLPED